MIVRPEDRETTSLGAAIAAAIATGVSVWDLRSLSTPSSLNTVFTARLPSDGLDCISLHFECIDHSH